MTPEERRKLHLAGVHISRKLRRFSKAHSGKAFAYKDPHRERSAANLARLDGRFRIEIPKNLCWGWAGTRSEIAARYGCEFRVSPHGWLEVTSDYRSLLSLRSEGAYAVYKLLERAFGKD